MASPFPGIDPFVEDQEWSDFHSNFIVELQAQLVPRLEPKYFVRVERRIYVEHPAYDEEQRPQQRIPVLSVHLGTGSTGAASSEGGTATLAAPVECVVPMPEERRESYLLIKETDTHEVVTVLELLSPSNKRIGGDGRREYLNKRDEVLRGATHLVELDLLRGGERLPIKPPVPVGDFYAIVSRSQRRPRVDVYAWRLSDPLPTISVPLTGLKESVPLDLGAALTAVYDRVRYYNSINYQAPLQTPLPPQQTDWVAERLRPAKHGT